MSYCRWSCDDFRSDVYCYESYYGGFVTCVAGRRYVGHIESLPALTADNVEGWMAAKDKQIADLDKCEIVPIAHPDAGEEFVDINIEDMLDRLEYLQREGFHVPQSAFDAIRAEIEESK